MDNFEIPSHKSELFVDPTLTNADIVRELSEARSNSKYGPHFITENSKAYFNVIVFGEKLDEAIIYSAYEDLHRVIRIYNEALTITLESLDEDNRIQHLNVLKILIYCYTQIVILFEQKQIEKSSGNLRIETKKKKTDQSYQLHKTKIVQNLNELLGQEIKRFWDPPVVEEAFINLVSEVCYRFLQNPTIKNDRQTLMELWSFLGTLMLHYNHNKTFVIRIVQLIKLHEHLVHCIPEGVKILVEKFNCIGMLHEIVQEMTDWQCEAEKFQDQQGAKNCAAMTIELSVQIPNLMLEEIKYLEKYLHYESPVLRSAILSMETEIILKILSRHDLTEEEKETRDYLFDTLIDHILDKTVTVRAKVMNHLARLQEEGAIPTTRQSAILKQIIPHCSDTGALARKAAVNMITTTLSTNPFSADLSLSKYKNELQAINEAIAELSEKANEKMQQMKSEWEERWKEKEDEVKALINEELSSEIDEMEAAKFKTDNEIDRIAEFLANLDFRSAAKVCKYNAENFNQFLEETDNDSIDKEHLVLMLIKDIYFKKNIVDEEMTRIGELNLKKNHFELIVEFLELLESAVPPILNLLDSQMVGDMHEALSFCVASYKFNIEKKMLCLKEMMKLMRRNEQDRKDAVVEALKSIYLTTDTEDRVQHSTIIVQNLINWLKTVDYSTYDDMAAIISRWAEDGTLDNYVIQTMWQKYTGNVPTSDEDKIAVLELLRIAAHKRPTIITKNKPLLLEYFSTDQEICDMRMVATFCRTFAIIGHKKIVDENSTEPLFRLDMTDDIFGMLTDGVAKNMGKKVPNFNMAIPEIITCIYKTCNKPEKVCEDLLLRLIKEQQEILMDSDTKAQMPVFLMTRWSILLGDIARNHLLYLDNPVYWELKRRNKMRENKDTKKKQQKSELKRRSALDTSLSVNNSTINNPDETELQGAEAQDTDAEFILNVLEKDTVTGTGLLGKLAFIFKHVCENPIKYHNPVLQGAAVIALMRYMLVSSYFCKDNIQLLFTILERAQNPNLKVTILLQFSDLITRFPNVVEPWIPNIYKCLDDDDVNVRIACYFSLSKLILKDMIRARGHIADMARCLVDENETLKSYSKTFFEALARKEDNLYNHLPDIFSHLTSMNVSKEHFEIIMKFLFGLIDKQKYMENLVDRFCLKLEAKDSPAFAQRVIFCLTLITYNDKAIKKLVENFQLYRHLLDDAQIYSYFKEIMDGASKTQPGKIDLKPFVAELEQAIEGVFEIKEGNQPIKKPEFKKPMAKKPAKRSRKKTRRSSDSDSD